MITKDFHIQYVEYSWEEFAMLPEHQLYEVAHQAAVQAYAPYSGFHVGAAIQLDDGRVFWASNQENKAYPSGICAERAVIYYVQANYPGHTIQKLLLVANHESLQTDEPVYPCGACRQVLVEAEERQKSPIEIWMTGKNRVHQVQSCSDLLPLKFIL
ncbi:MAG: cytidine deaminase [Bacteroidales bacterium]|jgi:cytidine deaminase|nr:cytidine deaminase [Bacteroidales bacterium]